MLRGLEHRNWESTSAVLGFTINVVKNVDYRLTAGG